jgi:hypothetical protein
MLRSCAPCALRRMAHAMCATGPMRPGAIPALHPPKILSPAPRSSAYPTPLAMPRPEGGATRRPSARDSPPAGCSRRERHGVRAACGRRAGGVCGVWRNGAMRPPLDARNAQSRKHEAGEGTRERACIFAKPSPAHPRRRCRSLSSSLIYCMPMPTLTACSPFTAPPTRFAEPAMRRHALWPTAKQHTSPPRNLSHPGCR